MITFKPDTHQYFDENGKELISVTTLMAKHGLAVNYEGIQPDVLKAAADRGTLIHKEIEEYIKTGEVGFTTELASFIRYLERTGADVVANEQIVHNDIVAGTFDLILHYGTRQVIADIKTTRGMNRNAVSWQLSLYAYLSGMEFDGAQVFHFAPDGQLEVSEITPKPLGEVVKLLDCERQGLRYYEATDLLSESQKALMLEAQTIIESAEKSKEMAELRVKEVREALITEMEKRGITKYEDDYLSITYIAPQERSTIDNARLKKEMPDIAEQFTKKSQVKASLRIKLKGE